MKCETHNHPRRSRRFRGGDRLGRRAPRRSGDRPGAKPRRDCGGFSVSHLCIPDFEQAWEKTSGRPDRVASALQIMLEGPIGAASFNNEFAPHLAGYFRAFEMEADGVVRGYHKPIMIAGGIGNSTRRTLTKARWHRRLCWCTWAVREC